MFTKVFRSVNSVLYLKLFEHGTSTQEQIDNHIQHNGDQRRRWLDFSFRSLHGLWVYEEAIQSSIINNTKILISSLLPCTCRMENLSNIHNSVASAFPITESDRPSGAGKPAPNVEATATMCSAHCCHFRCLPVASYRTWFCAPDAEWNTTTSGWGRFQSNDSAGSAAWNRRWLGLLKNTLQGTVTHPTKT